MLRDRLIGLVDGPVFREFVRRRGLRSIPALNPEQAGDAANGVIAERLLANLCPKNGTLIDIGAHIGSVIRVQRKDVTVIAVEADPIKSAVLIEKFPNCRIFDVALGEAEGEAEFYINPDATGYNSLVEMQGAQSVKVRVAALDDLLPTETADLIKMDIEGAELGALRGGEKLIQRSRPVVMFESMGQGINSLGYSADQVWRWFDERDFEICSPDRVAHTAPGFGLETFMDGHQYPFRSHDYFAIPREKREQTRDAARRILGIG